MRERAEAAAMSVIFRSHLGLSDYSSWALESLSARDSLTLRLLLEKRKNRDPPEKKSQQWSKFFK